MGGSHCHKVIPLDLFKRFMKFWSSAGPWKVSSRKESATLSGRQLLAVCCRRTARKRTVVEDWFGSIAAIAQVWI